MAITMQGTWTVGVKSKSAAFAQRFIIAGATTGNGTYPGETTTAPVVVTGDQWSITVQHRPTSSAAWVPSAERITFPILSAGQVRFDIQSNDSGNDLDYDDLILGCSMPFSPSEYVLYGNVKSYSGLCLFNPCYPFPWAVIDSPILLKEALKHAAVRKVLEDLYPERIREYLERPGVIRPPRPEPDPAPFIPMAIPMGTSLSNVSRIINVPAKETVEASTSPQKETLTHALSAQVQIRAERMEIGALSVGRIAPHAMQIAKLRDTLRIGCSSKVQPGLLLRFLEYDRTAAELAGGPYTGAGARQVLGLAVTDEQGNYIFRFTQTLEDLAAETMDIVAGGPAVATQLRPDIIVQIISGGTAGVLYESALYPDVPNLRRIDLCVPENVLNPGPTACQGGRAIQAIGNIWTIPGVGNALDVAGRITATNPTGPIITRGAWVGTLDVFACFLDRPGVKYYTIRFRKPGGSWAFVQEEYRHIKIADIGLPNYKGTRVGPDTRNLAVDGGPKVPAPSYLNIESDSEWVATHRLRKIQLTSSAYEVILYGPGESPRSVDFKIEGYSETGDKVAGAEDTIRLCIDNRPVTGDIAGVQMGAVSPGECALFELASPNAALTVRFKVDHPGGFLQSYGLAVVRGSNTNVPVSDTTAPVQPLSLDYNETTHGNFFFGTFNAVGPDGDRYVVAELQPNSGSWLPSGKNFCAFEFSVSATPRVTNGYSLGSGRTLDKELIGISYTPPSGS
ncbi:MAG: hypothetical protein NNA31_11030 [Nitrospira sp.]|nr:hypothetical protein [Nitrospira sp.]